MKVIPSLSLVDAQLSRAPATSLIDPAQSFEDLLQTPAKLRQQRQARAFSYSETGLLNAPSRAAEEAGMVSSATNETTTTRELAAIAAVKPINADAGLERPTACNLAPLAAVEAHASERSTPLRAQLKEAVQNATLAAQQGQPPSEVEAAETISGRLRLGPSAPRATPSPRLILSLLEQNGALQVVASAGGLDLEDRARLRKALDAVAAQFGLTVADFTLEGSFEPPASYSIGAGHGDHRG